MLIHSFTHPVDSHTANQLFLSDLLSCAALRIYFEVCVREFTLRFVMLIFVSKVKPHCHSHNPRANVQLEDACTLLLPAIHAGLRPPQHSQVPGGRAGHPELPTDRDKRHHRGCDLQRDQPQTRPGLHVLLHPLDQVRHLNFSKRSSMYLK